MRRLPSLPRWTATTTSTGGASAAAGAPLPAALAGVVAVAAQHVPFYRRHWSLDAGDGPLQAVRRFHDLPLLRKSDLLAAVPSELLDARYACAKLATEPTSGSSGTPFEMRIDPVSHRARRLRFLSALLANGYRPGRRILVVSSQPTAMIQARQGWARRLGWHYADLDSPEQVLAKAYAQARPNVLYGPLSALLDLAARLPADVLRHRPRSVVSTGEQLLPQHRRALQAAFGPDVTDFYGMTELGLLAWRAAAHDAYRVSRDFFLEFLPDATVDGLEQLVVTDLRGGAQPLVRFDTGDLVCRDHARPGRPITAFLGRRIDALVLVNGIRLSPYRLITALEGLAGVVEYAITQQADRSVDVTIRCTRENDAPVVAAAARGAVTELCPGLPVRVRCSPAPLARPEGKMRPIRSLATGDA